MNTACYLLHSSSEGKILEEPWDAPDEMVWQRTISPMDAKDEVTEITIEFERGDAVENPLRLGAV